jgi:hypothetical protein
MAAHATFFGDDDLLDDTQIWRYMDLARFVVLLSERRIRFTKATQLLAGDPYEGYGQGGHGDIRPCKLSGIEGRKRSCASPVHQLLVLGTRIARYVDALRRRRGSKFPRHRDPRATHPPQPTNDAVVAPLCVFIIQEQAVRTHRVANRVERRDVVPVPKRVELEFR